MTCDRLVGVDSESGGSESSGPFTKLRRCHPYAVSGGAPFKFFEVAVEPLEKWAPAMEIPPPIMTASGSRMLLREAIAAASLPKL